jgi:2-polyprenyl-6-methoxyphenol hydroxylase-like FAD-dependent oxidoreductase
MSSKNVLISGSGIAGLTLGILLKEKGWEPTIIERHPAMRTEAYVIDFFSTGWEVAERMGLIGEIRKITYPIDSLRFVDKSGKPFVSLQVASVRDAFKGKYAYLQRSDLERILYERAQSAGVAVRFGTTISSLADNGAEVAATFNDGSKGSYALVFGADGVRSRVRELVFGPEAQFDRFLGYYVAAFHIKGHRYDVGTSLNMYMEEPDRAVWTYSLGEDDLTAMFVFRHEDIGYVPPAERLNLLRDTFRGAGWIGEKLLADFPTTEPIFFDSATQIVMPSWSKGRVALLGDASACLTLLAGQGSHLAMAEAFVIANELDLHHGDHRVAFSAYEKTLRSATLKKQREAVRISKFFLPTERSIMPLRRLVERLFFSKLFIGYGLTFFGTENVLSDYR